MRLEKSSMMPLLLLLGGCACMQGSGLGPGPDATKLEKLPVVPYGQPVPENGEYVLHFPAGVSIETPVIFQGDLFQQASREVLIVKPARDIYLHKQWLSYDGKHWEDARKAIDLKGDVVLPSYDHPEPGYVLLEFNSVKRSVE